MEGLADSGNCLHAGNEENSGREMLSSGLKIGQAHVRDQQPAMQRIYACMKYMEWRDAYEKGTYGAKGAHAGQIRRF
jgi:hypothetical protein